jgi:capsular polysaccharide biosynthesis protein
MSDQHKIEQDEIDLIALIAQLYHKRGFIVKTTALFMILGLIMAFVSPKTYKSSTTFIVQGETKGVNSSISGLAALAGFNLNSDSMGDIPPSMYPNIVGGVPFKLSLLKTKLNVSSFTYKEYLLEKQNSLASTIKKYTLGLPSLILSSLNSPQQIEATENKGLNQLDEIEFELTESLDEMVMVDVNEKEGFITLSVLDQNPKYAAIVAKKALELLQNTITTFKTENAKRLLKYVSKQYELKKLEYQTVQKELAEFKDQNKNISTAVFESNLQKIQTRYDLVYSVYLELSRQLEQAKLQVNKDIPNISVIEPVYVPNKRESPKRGLILVIYTFLGVVISSGWVLISEPVFEIFRQVKRGE